MPASYRMRVRRPGLTVPDWWVTVSISIAWRRGIGHFQQFATELADGFAAGRLPDRRTRRLPPLPSLHTRLVLTTLGHPHSDGADERRGAAKFDSGRDVHKPRTKPESDRKQRNCKNQPRDDGAKTGVRAFHIGEVTGSGVGPCSLCLHGCSCTCRRRDPAHSCGGLGRVVNRLERESGNTKQSAHCGLVRICELVCCGRLVHRR